MFSTFSLISSPVGVQILITTHKKYLFRSLLTTQRTPSGVLFALATPICNIIFMILSRKDDPCELIRMAFLVKLIHIPAYIIIFIFGVIAAIMIFMTLPLILMLILFDCILLFFSSSISVFALAKNIKSNKILSVVALICQFFFCADVISLLILQFISKNQPILNRG